MSRGRGSVSRGHRLGVGGRPIKKERDTFYNAPFRVLWYTSKDATQCLGERHAPCLMFMVLGFGGGRGRERETHTRGYEPFALHAPIRVAMLKGCDQEEGRWNLVLAFDASFWRPWPPRSSARRRRGCG